jgi:hypothetical protein
MTWVLGVACACVTCCSSMASATYPGMEADYGVGREVCTLSISLFVAGLGVGPCKLVSTHCGCEKVSDDSLSIPGPGQRVHRSKQSLAFELCGVLV